MKRLTDLPPANAAAQRRVARLTLSLAAFLSCFSVALPAQAHGRAHRHPPRRGGHVRRAWPAKGAPGRPNLAMARWLARQVGPTIVTRPAASFDQFSTAPADGPGFQAAGAMGPLQLVRSYQIPAGDPSAPRLANLSWTYDSAVAAIAFLELGARPEAQQLLDQLRALQRTDGSIDFAFNTQTGASIPLFRSGTIAWLGLAAVDYREKTCTSQYDSVALGAAQWLLAQQVTNPSSLAYGLLRGGPDVPWVSTQHNLIARAFFKQFANSIAGANRCPGGLAGMSSAAASAFAASLRSAVTSIDSGINRALFVRVGATSAYFQEGVGDGVEPLDAQALGVLYLLGQGRNQDATAVENFTNAHMALGGRSIVFSANPATFNETYSAAGPFLGYRPYGDPAAPDVLWMEGTLEMRLALARSGVSTSALDGSLLAWAQLTGVAGPLQADRVVTGDPFNEYHVWPASAAAAWALLNLTNFGSLLQ